MHEDSLWVRRALEGDRRAFERLVHQYQSSIYRQVCRSVKRAEDAEDITQEVFLRAYQHLSSLREADHFEAWLHQIARNRVHDWHRQQTGQFVSLPTEHADPNPTPEEVAMLREVVAKIMQAIESLPEPERELLKARAIEGKDYAQLQAEHGFSYKAVTMRVLRAKAAVREKVKKLLSGVLTIPAQLGRSRLFLQNVGGGITVKAVSAGIGMTLLAGGAGWWAWHATHLPASDLPMPAAISETPSPASALTEPRISQPTTTRSRSSRSQWMPQSADVSEASQKSSTAESSGAKAESADTSVQTAEGNSSPGWQSDSEYQTIYQEFREKRKQLDAVDKRMREIQERLRKLPHSFAGAYRDDPQWQEFASLSKEFQSLAFKQNELYPQVMALWEAMETIKQRYAERSQP